METNEALKNFIKDLDELIDKYKSKLHHVEIKNCLTLYSVDFPDDHTFTLKELWEVADDLNDYMGLEPPITIENLSSEKLHEALNHLNFRTDTFSDLKKITIQFLQFIKSTDSKNN